ncbi:MAG: cadherin-like beta sandwich domain-containing protein [Bacilli bacterium]
MIKNISKFISIFLVMVVVSLSFTKDLNALTGYMKASSNRSTVTPGSIVKVTVKVSSNSPLGSYEFSVNYDSSMLQLQGSTSLSKAEVGNGSSKSASFTYTFKALKIGSTKVSLKNTNMIDWNTDEKMTVNVTNASITIKKPEVIVLSDNNNLSSLSVEGVTLSPTFNKNTLEYSVTLPENIKEAKINATTEDNKAKIAGIGTVSLTQGTNTFNIVVTSEKGNTKTYKITLNVIDENPIKVTVGENEYTVVKYSGVFEVPTNYIEETIKIKDQEVNSFISEITNLRLVGLKDEKGNSELYVHDNDEFTLYKEYSLNKVIMYFTDSSKVEVPKNLSKVSVVINGDKINGFKLDNSADGMYIVYGMNIVNGNIGFYIYDQKEETFLRYMPLLEEKEEVNIYFYLTIGLGCLSFLLLIILIVKSIKKKDKPKKEKKKKRKKTKEIISLKDQINNALEEEQNSDN